MLYFFYTLVSERQCSGTFFFLSSISSGFPGERFVHESVPAGIDSRSSQFFLTNLTHESNRSHLISSAIRSCLACVRICGSKREKGAHRAPDSVLSLATSPGCDEV